MDNQIPKDLPLQSSSDELRNPIKKPVTSGNAKKQYLVLYNWASAALWTIVLGRVILLIFLLGVEEVYAGVGDFAKWTQTLALLEVGHAATGIVRAPISTTTMQVSSRLLLVWGVVKLFPQLATSTGYSSMLIAWSITEVVRYSFFTCALNGYQPAVLSWLRYNLFYVLYPLGISSECWMIWKAVGPAKQWNVAYAWLLQAILLVYIPGSYILFTHMMSQRRKVMKGKGKQT